MVRKKTNIFHTIRKRSSFPIRREGTFVTVQRRNCTRSHCTRPFLDKMWGLVPPCTRKWVNDSQSNKAWSASKVNECVNEAPDTSKFGGAEAEETGSDCASLEHLFVSVSKRETNWGIGQKLWGPKQQKGVQHRHMLMCPRMLQVSSSFPDSRLGLTKTAQTLVFVWEASKLPHWLKGL